MLGEVAGQPASIGGIGFVPPHRVIVKDMEAGPVKAGELRVDVSLPGLIRGDLAHAIRRFSLRDGEIDLAEEGPPLSFWLEGELSARESGFELRLDRGEIEIGGETWRLQGDGRVLDGALVDARLSLADPEQADARLDVVTLTPVDFGIYELHIKGVDLPLIKIWQTVLASLSTANLDSLPAPAHGWVDIDLRLGLDAFRLRAAYGEATVRELAWAPVDADYARINLDAERASLGGGTGDAAMSEKAGGYAANLFVELGSGRVYHHEISQAQGVITGGPDGWTVTGVEARGKAGARYRAYAHLTPGDGEAPYIVIDGEQVPLQEAARWLRGAGSLSPGEEGNETWRVDSPRGDLMDALLDQLAGTAAGSVRLQLGAYMGVQGEVELENAWIGTLRLATGTLGFDTGEAGVQVSGELGLGGGRLIMNDIGIRPDALSGSVQLERVALPALEALAEMAGLPNGPKRWRGRVSGQIQLEGTPESPGISGRLTGERAGWGGIAWDRVEVSGAWRGDEWEIENIRASGPGAFELDGQGRGNTRDLFQVDLVWRDLSFKDAGEIFGYGWVRRIDAAVSGELQVERHGERTELKGRADAASERDGEKVKASFAFRGDLDQGLKVDGTVAAGEGEATVALAWSPQKSRLAASLQEMSLAAGAGILGLTGINGAVSGDIQLEQHPHESPVGTVRLEAAELDMGALFVRDASISLDLSGSPQDGQGHAASCPPCLFGEGWIRGRIAARKGSQKADPFALQVHFRGDEVALAPAVVRLAKGTVELNGAARRSEAGWELGFESTGHGLEYNNGSGLYARLDYQARLFGPLASPRLKATARLKEGLVDLFRLQRWGSPKAPSRMGMDLDVDFEVSSLRLSARSLLDAEVAGQLNLKAIGGELYASGAVGVIRGYFGYLGRRFEIVRGEALFPGGGLIPHLDVVGQVRTQGVTLIVEATGPADDLALSAKTDPPVEQERLRELMMEPLGTGSDGLGGDWRSLASVLSSALNRQVVSEFYWTLERALENALGVDFVEIASRGRDLELTLGKYLTPGLYLAYQRSLTREEEDRVEVEYRLGRHSQLRTRWDRQQGTHLDLGVSLPF